VLVLRRRVGEAIVIGEGIEIEVVEISRTRVKLGITAPRDVAVSRRETTLLAEENRLACDLVPARGTDGVGDLLRLLGNLSAETIQTPLEVADK
jgi:carbon storage regulator